MNDSKLVSELQAAFQTLAQQHAALIERVGRVENTLDLYQNVFKQINEVIQEHGVRFPEIESKIAVIERRELPETNFADSFPVALRELKRELADLHAKIEGTRANNV